MSLKERYERFMRSTPGIESIDDLLRTRDVELKGCKRADFLACGRKVVIETKSIDIDPADKIQRFLDDIARSGRLPKAGETTLGELLLAMPDGQTRYDEFIVRITRILEDNIARADGQTRDTKSIFGIPHAIGVVVILNECAPLLSPDQSMLRMFEALNKRRSDGTLRYVQNHIAIYISEAHTVDLGSGNTMYPMATVYSEAGNAIPFATTVAESLHEKWAAFNGAGYLPSSELWDNFKPLKPTQQITVMRPIE